MDLNIKDKIEELIDKVKSDKGFAAAFAKDPVKAVEKALGVDLPDEQVKRIAEGVKAKVSLDKLGDVAEKLGGFFKK